MRKRIWILCCLLAVLLAACGEQPKEPVQPQPPAVTEEPEDPEQHVVKAPKKEDQSSRRRIPATWRSWKYTAGSTRGCTTCGWRPIRRA